MISHLIAYPSFHLMWIATFLCLATFPYAAYAGPGNATDIRTVQCKDDLGIPVDDSLCAGAGTKPATTQVGVSCTGSISVYAGCRVETTGWDVMNSVAVNAGSASCYTDGIDPNSGGHTTQNLDPGNEVVVFTVGTEYYDYNTNAAALYGNGSHETLKFSDPSRFSISWGRIYRDGAMLPQICTNGQSQCVVSPSGFDGSGNALGNAPNGNYTVTVTVTDNTTGQAYNFSIEANKQTYYNPGCPSCAME